MDWREHRDREMAHKKRLGLLRPGGIIYMPGPNTGKTVTKSVKYGDYIVTVETQRRHRGLAGDRSSWEIWPWSEAAGRHVPPQSRYHKDAARAFLSGKAPS